MSRFASRMIAEDSFRVSGFATLATMRRVVPPRDGAVYDGVWAWLWPNIAINVYAEGLMIERMSPLDHARTRLDYTYLTPDGAAVPQATLTMSDQVTAEDKWITEVVQRNLGAGIYAAGRLSPKHEIAIAAFQAWVRERIESF